jgi:transposase
MKLENSKHPQWATKHRQKGTELRLINDKYYLYEVSSKWNPEKKRSQKITGKLLGKITEKDGFIESAKHKLHQGFQKNITQPLQIKEFGASSFIDQQCKEFIELIKKHFPDIWQEIVALGFIRLVHQAPIKNTELLFETSYLSELYPNVVLSDKRVGALFRKIGTQRDRVVSFMKEFHKPQEHILFDATHIVSHSKGMDIAKVGYNSQMSFDPQINLMMMFSAQQQMPVFYRILPGNIREVTALGLTLEESEIRQAVMVADKGFYSQLNIEDAEKLKLNYVIPLKRDNQLIDYKKAKRVGKAGYEGYFSYQDRFIWFYQIQIQGRIVYLFYDDQLRAQEEKDYLSRIEKKSEGYTLNEFKQKQHAFGTMSILTNLTSKSAQEIYEYYKVRGNIETMFDTLKNTLKADHSYMQNPQAFDGWMFINFIALQWYYHICQMIRSKELLKKFSPLDFLLHLTQIKKIKINNQWRLAEVTKKTKTFLEKLDIHIT